MKPLRAVRRRFPTAIIRTWTINADNYRDRKHPGQLANELRSIAAYAPDVIAIVEATGNRLPALPGYTLIRDDSTLSRSNVAAYVSDDLRPSHVQWHDLRLGWPRTNPGAIGRHEPRSILTFRIGGRVRIIVGHQPPPGATLASKTEHIARLTLLFNRNVRWPVILLWDSNGWSQRLARLVGATVHGRRVDAALARGVVEGRAHYVDKWARIDGRGMVRFGGDHRHVLRNGFVIPAKWLTRTPK